MHSNRMLMPYTSIRLGVFSRQVLRQLFRGIRAFNTRRQTKTLEIVQTGINKQ